MKLFNMVLPLMLVWAPGLDRILMMLLDEDSIRETIVFPMSASGSDILMNAPSNVTEEQLREVHIKVRD